MAREALTPITTSRSGVALAYTAAIADGHSFANSGQDVVLFVKNGSGAPVNVTVDIPKVVDGVAMTDLVVAVAAGATRIIGPFPKGLYNQSGNVVHVDYSATASVEVAAVKLGSPSA